MKKLITQSFWITILMLLLMWGLANIPLQFEAFNPIQNVFKDFDMTDITFSYLHSDKIKEDKNIVLVNIGNANRAEIGKALEIIGKEEPKVVGIDVFFRSLKGNEQDTLLKKGIESNKNIVLISKVDKYNEKKNQYDTLEKSNPFFSEKVHYGYANVTTTGQANMTEFLTIRSFIPTTKAQGKTQNFIAVEIAKLYDEQKTKKFLARNNLSEYINFKGNIAGDTSVKNIVYTALDLRQVLNEEFKEGLFKNKIVFFGFMGNSIYQKSFDDKFYTPFNLNYVGKSTPDMFGVVVHANVISMILDENYINEFPEYLNIFLSILFAFLNVFIFVQLYKRIGFWYTTISLLLQLVFSLLLLTFDIYVFATFKMHIDIGLGLLSIVLSGFMVEFYYGLALKLYSHLKTKTKKERIKEDI
jgi:CHASE2 domain-containing sensor protein